MNSAISKFDVTVQCDEGIPTCPLCETELGDLPSTDGSHDGCLIAFDRFFDVEGIVIDLKNLTASRNRLDLLENLKRLEE